MIVVFHDGACSLCRREMEYYKYIAVERIFHRGDIAVAAFLARAVALLMRYGGYA